jgi:hypothetical protein
MIIQQMKDECLRICGSNVHIDMHRFAPEMCPIQLYFCQHISMLLKPTMHEQRVRLFDETESSKSN